MVLDLRGVRCPLSWAKAKLYLEEQAPGTEVELILDDPKGARDIPRAAEAEGAEPPTYVEEIPYGLQVSDDCAGLVESPSETQAIMLALDMIVEDCPLSRVADALNRRGHLTRSGKPWTPSAVFNLLPRMIEVGPRVFASEEWMTRRRRLPIPVNKRKTLESLHLESARLRQITTVSPAPTVSL
jgi:TusA-related sulfurtransferase